MSFFWSTESEESDFCQELLNFLGILREELMRTLVAVFLATTVSTLGYAKSEFDGIWLADGNEPLALDSGCYLMVRMTSAPESVLRAVVCSDGRMQIDSAKIRAFVNEPSRFGDGEQVRAELGTAKSSCKERQSRLPPLASLAFDLRTAAGGEAASFAYMQYGEIEVAFHAGGAIDSLNRNKDCEYLVSQARNPTNDIDQELVRLAAKVCQAESERVGCFTPNGFKSIGAR